MITAKRIEELQKLAREHSTQHDGPALLNALIINDGLRQLGESLNDIGPAVEKLAEAVDRRPC